MSIPPDLIQRMRDEAARGLPKLDRAVYTAAGRDPLAPLLLGSGSLQARLGIFGRDPGRFEVQGGEPFVGRGGQLLRDGLRQAAGGAATSDLDALIDAGRGVFWVNTVPYKPIGNKPWGVRVQRRFAPMIRELLVDHWTGDEMICCGRGAPMWFGLAEPALAGAVQAHWARDDRFTTSLEVALGGKRIRLHPLPHPSPANAAWFSRFPGLLAGRLTALGWPG